MISNLRETLARVERLEAARQPHGAITYVWQDDPSMSGGSSEPYAAMCSGGDNDEKFVEIHTAWCHANGITGEEQQARTEGRLKLHREFWPFSGGSRES